MLVTFFLLAFEKYAQQLFAGPTCLSLVFLGMARVVQLLCKGCLSLYIMMAWEFLVISTDSLPHDWMNRAPHLL